MKNLRLATIGLLASLLAISLAVPRDVHADGPTPVSILDSITWRAAIQMRKAIDKDGACGCSKPKDFRDIPDLDSHGNNIPAKDGFEIRKGFVLFQECGNCRSPRCISNFKASHQQLESDFTKRTGARNLFNAVHPDITAALAGKQADIAKCEATMKDFANAASNGPIVEVTPGFGSDLPNLVNTMCVYQSAIQPLSSVLTKWVPSSTNTQVYQNGCGAGGALPPALKELETAGFGGLAKNIGAKCCSRSGNFQASCVGGSLSEIFRQLSPANELYDLTIRRRLETSAVACDLNKYGRNSGTPDWAPVRQSISDFDDKFRASIGFNSAAPTSAAKADYAPSDAAMNAYAVLGAYGDPIKGKAGGAKVGSAEAANPNPPPPDLPQEAQDVQGANRLKSGSGSSSATATGLDPKNRGASGTAANQKASGCPPKDLACVRAYFKGKKNLFGPKTGCGCDIPTDTEFDAATQSMSTFSSGPVWKRLNGACPKDKCASPACTSSLAQEFDALAPLPAQSFKSSGSPLRVLHASIAKDLQAKCGQVPDPAPSDPAEMIGTMKQAFKCWQDNLSKLRILATYSPSINGKIENVTDAMKADFPSLKAELESGCTPEKTANNGGCLTASLANVQAQVKGARDAILWKDLLPVADLEFLSAASACGAVDPLPGKLKGFTTAAVGMYAAMRDMSGSGGALAPDEKQAEYWAGKSVVPIPRSIDAVSPALDKAVNPLAFSGAAAAPKSGSAAAASLGGGGSGETPKSGSGLGTLGASGSGDSYVNKCMDNTFLCNAATRGSEDPLCNSYCSEDLRAVGALKDDLNGIAAQEGLKVGSQQIVKVYLSNLRAKAVTNTIKTFGQLVGNYDFTRFLDPKEKEDFDKGCLGNTVIKDSLSPFRGKPLSSEDAKVFGESQTDDYKIGLGRAAMDVMRNLYRFNYPWDDAPKFGNAPGRKVPDPDCKDIGDPSISFSGDAMVINPPANYSSPAAIRSCCACTSNDNQMLGSIMVNRCGPAISTESCKWVTSYNMGDFKDNTGNTKGEAAAKIRTYFSAFPLLAAGVKDWGEDALDAKKLKSNLRSVYDTWDAAFKKDPKGKLDNLRYDGLSTHEIGASDMDGPIRSMRERAAKDFAHSIALFCRGDRTESKCLEGAKTGAKVGAAMPMVGTTAAGAVVGCVLTPDEAGVTDWDLIQLDGLKKQVMDDTENSGNPGGITSLYRAAAECTKKAWDEHKSDRAIGNIGLGVGCLAAGIASAPTVAGPAAVAALCGTAFVGVAAGEYKETATKARTIGICAGGASASVGACTMADVQKADDEHKAAALNLAVTVLGEAVGAGAMLKEMTAIKGAAKWLSPAEIDQLAKDLAAAKGRDGIKKALEEGASQATEEQASHQSARATLTDAAQAGTAPGKLAKPGAITDAIKSKYLKSATTEEMSQLQEELERLERAAAQAEKGGKKAEDIAEAIDRRMAGCTPH